MNAPDGEKLSYALIATLQLPFGVSLVTANCTLLTQSVALSICIFLTIHHSVLTIALLVLFSVGTTSMYIYNNSHFLSPPVLIHGGLLGVALCPSVCPSVHLPICDKY